MSREWLDLPRTTGRGALYVQALRKRGIQGEALPLNGLRCRVPVQPDRLADYARVCGVTDLRSLPPLYPHVMAFDLQLQLMTSPDFPFPVLGMVHLHNRLEVLQPLVGLDALTFTVHTEGLMPHAKGGTFDLVTEARDGTELLWRETSRLLVRGLRVRQAPRPSKAVASEQAAGTPLDVTRWQADVGIGRRYARVAGDYNPIHLSSVSARLFGFPQAIAHGLWSKARALEALSGHLPEAGYCFSVAFQRPVRLPSEVVLTATAPGPSGVLRLSGQGGSLHMQGDWSRC